MKVRDSGMPEEALWATFFDPPAILDVLLLDNPRADIVEFGRGYGTFTIAAATRTAGTIYAVEIDPAMIETTDRKAIAAGQTNIRVALRDFVKEGSGLSGVAADYAMLFINLHAPDPLALLREAFRLLRSEGKIAQCTGTRPIRRAAPIWPSGRGRTKCAIGSRRPGSA